MLSTQRIRCNYCNRRIPANAVRCPNCQRNPRAFYWKRWHVLVLLAFVAVGLAVGAYYFSDRLKPLVPTGIAFSPNATATRTRTRAPITVVLVATNAPSTATGLPAPTRATTATPHPSDVPTLSPFAATPLPAGAPAQTPVPTETPSPVPSPVPVDAPQPVSPADQERIIGSNKRVLLEFQPAQPLGAQQWFRIQVDFLDRADSPVSWCGFTRASSQEFPRDFFDDSSPNVRSFLWRVNVVRSNQFNPATCDAPYDILSASSEVRTFYWY